MTRPSFLIVHLDSKSFGPSVQWRQRRQQSALARASACKCPTKPRRQRALARARAPFFRGFRESFQTTCYFFSETLNTFLN